MLFKNNQKKHKFNYKKIKCNEKNNKKNILSNPKNIFHPSFSSIRKKEIEKKKRKNNS